MLTVYLNDLVKIFSETNYRKLWFTEVTNLVKNMLKWTNAKNFVIKVIICD